jgi:hypothetical protein
MTTIQQQQCEDDVDNQPGHREGGATSMQWTSKAMGADRAMSLFYSGELDAYLSNLTIADRKFYFTTMIVAKWAPMPQKILTKIRRCLSGGILSQSVIAIYVHYLVSIWPAFCLNTVHLYVVTAHCTYSVNISYSLAVNLYFLQAITYPLMW